MKEQKRLYLKAIGHINTENIHPSQIPGHKALMPLYLLIEPVGVWEMTKLRLK